MLRQRSKRGSYFKRKVPFTRKRHSKIGYYAIGQYRVFRDFAGGGRKLGFGQISYGKGFYTYL